MAAMRDPVRVVVAYEIAAKTSHHLEKLLRDEVPKHISCKFLEATTHAEQVPLEAEVDRGRDEQSGGLAAEDRDAGEDGELAGASGEVELEQGGRLEDDGGAGPAVLREAHRAVEGEPESAGEIADSGAREGTGEDIAIVPEE